MLMLLTVLGGPVLIAILTALLRRWPRIATLVGSGSVALLTGFIAVVGPAAGDQAVEIHPLGRTLMLDAATARILLLLYGGTAVLLLMASLWPQGADFGPAAIAALAPLAFALMIRPFVYGVVALVAAATLQVGVIQAGRAGSTRGAMHYLTVMVLAAPFFLVAGWMLESEQLVFLGTLWRLLIAGIALLLAAVPFHFWIRPVVEEAPPLAVVFVLGLGQLVSVTFVVLILQEHAVFAQTGLQTWLRVAGVVTMGGAGLLAFAAVDGRQAVAYSALLDMGAVLATLGAGTAGVPVLLTLLIARTLALLLAAVGLFQFEAADEPETNRWWPVLLSWYGAFSLIGLPLTPGFAGRWGAIALVGTQSPWLAAAAIAGVGLGAAGLWRTLPRSTLPMGDAFRRRRLALSQVIAILLLLVAGLLALFPSWTVTLSTTLAALFA
jgi:NADH:ubiquinone oxidoreductase subunit 2 (subunit N)